MDKVCSVEEALAGMTDGVTIAVGGFGLGHRLPSTLITAVSNSGVKEICLVANGIGMGPNSAEQWVINGQVNRLKVSFSARAGKRTIPEDKVAAGEIELEVVPQGMLVDRMRAAAAGIPAFYSPTGVGTPMADGKEEREFGGRRYILETALPVDYSLLRAHRADRAGNVEFRGASRNFNPSFAKAARHAIVEADEIVEVGEIDPENVGLPGIFVSSVVQSTVVIAPDIGQYGRRAADSRREYNGKPALTRSEMAARAAELIEDGSYVNLGAGLPNLMASHLSHRDIWLHGENGILGYGERIAGADEFDPDVFDAGGGFVRSKPGMSFFDSVTSFEVARGGRLTHVALGGYQVDSGASLANWSNPNQVGGGVGGAMDLVAAQTNLIIVMEHCDSSGSPKLVAECTYPLTGANCVNVVVTDLALLSFRDGRFVLDEVAPGFTAEEVLALTTIDAVIGDDVKEMSIPV
jgi:3-oxoacid CoA-transferase